MNEWVPVLTAVTFGVLFVLLLGFGMRLVMQVKGGQGKLEKQVASLQAKVKSQEEEIKALKARLDDAVDDPVPAILDSALDWRHRGPLMTGALVGARLFRSYWKGRKASGLPARKES